MEKTKRITRTNFKSFIAKNAENLFIMTKSSFDGMTDCVQNLNDMPLKVDQSKIDFESKTTFGIQGVWLVGSSRDWFYDYEDAMFKGFRVSNCCGSFIVATLKAIA
jgi:hypothetical protein